MLKMLISIVVPVYNEEDNIPVFYGEVLSTLSQTPYDWEIIFINDGSRDRSVAVINEHRARDPRVKLLELSRNFGSYSAISAGLLYAQGDAIICISADLQDPPRLMLDFIKAWEGGADIAWGVRAERVDPGLKSFYANTFYWLMRKIVWQDFPQGGMDYGLFDKRVIHYYNNLPSRNTNTFFTIYNMGFEQAFIPYKREARLHGEGNWPFFKRVKNAVDVIVDFSYFPIRIIAMLGYIISTLSLTYVAFVILYRLLGGEVSAGWASLMVAIAFLGGIQLVVLGLLGEYIWRVAEQVRERPRFFIKGRNGFETDHNPGSPLEQYLPHSHVAPHDPDTATKTEIAP